MARRLRPFVAVLLAAVVLAACLATTSVRSEDREAGFLLTISSPHLVWGADQPISVSAEFSYLGPGSVAVSGPGPGPHVKFAVVELTGDREMQPLWLMACAYWEMSRNPLAYSFRKGGGYSPDEPNAAFYEAWNAEPEFLLPPGRWEVSALAPFSLGQCAGRNINLKATVTLTVQ
ncbi:MAG TPA: hypothetical protein VL687_03440 [Methylomirabilota bacterium]|nr:hypothetical protein [Methylomirabilota bacterium]